MTTQRDSSVILPGTLDLLLLRLLAERTDHGSGLTRRLSLRSGGTFLVEEGSLYPALYRLEAQSLLTSEWRRTERGRRAKFYAITTTGQQRLVDERQRWEIFSHAVAQILGQSGEPSLHPVA